jgi:hypothetical protein
MKRILMVILGSLMFANIPACGKTRPTFKLNPSFIITSVLKVLYGWYVNNGEKLVHWNILGSISAKISTNQVPLC